MATKTQNTQNYHSSSEMSLEENQNYSLNDLKALIDRSRNSHNKDIHHHYYNCKKPHLN